jgi:hypothetical protein
MRARLLIILWAWDHAILATVTLGKCLSYEMISSALWSLETDGKLLGIVLRPIVDFAARCIGAGHDHCLNSYLWQQKIYNESLK